MDRQTLKANIAIIGILVAIVSLIVIPLVIATNKKNNKENFPNYSEININKNNIKDPESESYFEIKTQLENDYNFKKEALISNYNYKNYTSADLQKMVWYYIFAFEHNNTRFLVSKDEEIGRFCMRSRYVIDSFEELYGVKITEEMEIMPYYETVTRNGNTYCFYFKDVLYGYNNSIDVFIDGMSIKDGVVTTNLFLYEYYITETEMEKAYVSSLKEAIVNSNYIEANNIVEKKLNGTVTHKQLSFVINNNGKFFQYQILSSKNLDY